MYNIKDIYLLKHSTECVHYVLCEEIQIVSVDILDNRIDEIEYWQLNVTSHLKKHNTYHSHYVIDIKIISHSFSILNI